MLNLFPLFYFPGRLSRPVSQCFAILEELENDEFALNFADDENGDETSSVASFF